MMGSGAVVVSCTEVKWNSCIQQCNANYLYRRTIEALDCATYTVKDTSTNAHLVMPEAYVGLLLNLYQLYISRLAVPPPLQGS